MSRNLYSTFAACGFVSALAWTPALQASTSGPQLLFMGGPRVPNAQINLGYSISNEVDTSRDQSWQQQQLSFGLVLPISESLQALTEQQRQAGKSKGSRQSIVFATASVESWLIDSDARLPDTNQAMPDQLDSVELSLGYSRQLTGGRMFGISVGIQSASDEVFADSDNTGLQATATYTLPTTNRDSWIFMLQYDQQRSFLPEVPIPGVAYRWASHPEWTVMLGLPILTVNYRPSTSWSHNLSIFASNINVSSRYRLNNHVDIKAGFGNKSANWFRQDRLEDDQVLQYEYYRAELSLRWRPIAIQAGPRLIGPITIDASLAYDFERQWQETDPGDSPFDSDDFNRIYLDDGMTASLALGMTF